MRCGVLFGKIVVGERSLKSRFTTLFAFISLLVVSVCFAGTTEFDVPSGSLFQTDKLPPALFENWDEDTMVIGEGSPIENLSFPVNYYDDGTVRAFFKARKAFVPDDPKLTIRAIDVEIIQNDTNGRQAGIIVAKKCAYLRREQLGYSEGEVRLFARAPDKAIVLCGTNMVWDLVKQNVRISVSPKVTMAPIMNELGDAFR